jgi:adenosylcobyric acid synthase
VYAHGLFESPAVVHALFGASAPTLEDSFELLADMAQEHLNPVLLQRLFGQ